MIKLSILNHFELDLIGLAETHLIGNSKVEIPGYTWFGQNRKSLHFRTRKGSGGVGFLVKNSLFDQYDIHVCDDSFEGLLWLELKDKQINDILRTCVCYLVPEFSTRNVNSQEFFDRLLCQIHNFQSNSALMLLGDFNSRIGSSEDFIAGVDNLPTRNIVDFQTNSYCDTFLDFLICTNFCVLNGRNYDSNDFTYVSAQGGASVIDYCLVPYEDLERYRHFNVHRMRQLIESAVGIQISSSSKIPDHSFLTWNFVTSNNDMYESTERVPVSGEKDACFTKYDRMNIPPSFMSDYSVISRLNLTIDRLQTNQTNQHSMDTVYSEFCDTLKSEMNRLLNPKTVLLSSATQKKEKTL